MSILVSHLSKNYGLQKAVNDISFSIQRGEIVGFLGPNGAGKSTTMKMITGYLQADEGTIEVCGVTVSEKNIDTKSKIGYLPEANPLYTDMYIREYLDFIANVHQVPSKNQRISEVIELVGLSPESHKKIGQLSKGYKQRVGLAAALVHDPEVLILDEPTSGLDPNQIIEIREVIKKLGEKKTVLFSSHIMQEVEALCERVIIINKGNIVVDDRLQNLKKSGNRSDVILVSFDQPIDENLFKGFSDILSTERQKNSSYKFQTNNAESLKKQILQLSLEKNLNIVSMQTSSENLEDIFKTLTT